MTLVRADTFAEFLTKFAAAREAGANPQPVGANEMVLPDDTDPAVLQRLFGAVAANPPPAPAKTRSKTGKEI